MTVGPTPPDVIRLLHEHPPQTEETEHGPLKRSLAVQLHIERHGTGPDGRPLHAAAQFELPNAAIWPGDEALAAWRAEAGGGQIRVVYE